MTLIEVVMALFVLMIGVLGLMSVYVAANASTRVNSDQSAGANVATEAVNQLTSYESLHWTWPAALPAQLQAGSPPAAPTFPAQTVGKTTFDVYFSYDLCTLPAQCPNPAVTACPAFAASLPAFAAPVMEVTVTVTWKGAAGAQRYHLTSGLVIPKGATC